MKANELMIGDWVINKPVSDIPVQIEQINEQTVYYKRRKGYKGYWSSGVELLEPVPLTGAILKANGFNREGGASYWHEGGYNACILYWNEEKVQLIIGSPCDDCMVKMNVRYVHELQHAFRLLGIDKEIKLED